MKAVWSRIFHKIWWKASSCGFSIKKGPTRGLSKVGQLAGTWIPTSDDARTKKESKEFFGGSFEVGPDEGPSTRRRPCFFLHASCTARLCPASSAPVAPCLDRTTADARGLVASSFKDCRICSWSVINVCLQVWLWSDHPIVLPLAAESATQVARRSAPSGNTGRCRSLSSRTFPRASIGPRDLVSFEGAEVWLCLVRVDPFSALALDRKSATGCTTFSLLVVETEPWEK